ncbi:carboxylating nicotinate-nucleotide diphosphorylase [Oceanicella actignis]|uniref:Probable nicotinate-nucleotide pyrophosphorylase [carboxylating] n=1 Tax=Oceanicella actignis TaxID=1189325 RepID=A0A1M7T9X4_9RHOB|nr:carboxylating nicotinate-nucleotide diphosphorylase [Oceanicella actignis]TYO89155.1 nicotinate-nucleotide pyrophosphorylase [carboxylating] [Oceanicella actignis]SET51453.1 nicotinate-nucleotide pyrophosphorylase [carboxylating] [Oceanicella actignis]SHN67483.1 nicotinate-nucleotide pyrophosphorylase [carboxylating] [Oceanicella actignis]
MTRTPYPATLPAILVEDAVAAALREDLGRAGDVTSCAVVAPDAQARAAIVAREAGRLCGVDFARAAFEMQRAGLRVEPLARDGDALAPGQAALRVEGSARAILAGERVALNFMCHLSGIATQAARFVAAAAGTRARVCDTRKTTPGLRAFEKYAVRCGGAANHRFGLDDAILIKDNHIAVAGGVAQAVAAARAYAGHLMAIEVEVDTLAQLREALEAEVEAVLLDNFPLEALREAVAINRAAPRPARLEASGGVTLETVPAIAAAGVDFISSSRLTMGAGTLDLGLDIEIAGA